MRAGTKFALLATLSSMVFDDTQIVLLDDRPPPPPLDEPPLAARTHVPHTRHQGAKERARRLKQMQRKAHT